MKILLVDPKSSTTYPPLGLMKLATYHKLQGDTVHYVIGTDKGAKETFWDKIYMSTVFTYDLPGVVKTIQYYTDNHFNMKNMMVGGVAATLLPDYIKENTGVHVHTGLLNQEDEFLKRLSKNDKRFSYLKDCESTIDNLPPDYSIFPENSKYKKLLDSSYILYATKGCPNKCSFCAVNRLEPKYVDYIPIKPRVDYIKDNFGEKYGLILLDNNVASSKSYDLIMAEIRAIGFGKGEVFSYDVSGRTIKKKKFVDFNQGIDARLMDKKKMDTLATTAINPMRLAFDDIKYRHLYEEKMMLAIEAGIKDLSNYMLFNNSDKPEELYERFAVNTRLKDNNPDIRIFSFPMRFSPVELMDRKHVGEYWTARQIRALQIILNATHGIVSHKHKFFHRAFGKNADEFSKLLLMPYNYIINRDLYEKHIEFSFTLWETLFVLLSENEKEEVVKALSSGKLIPKKGKDKVKEFLSLYRGEHVKVIPREDWPNELDRYIVDHKELLTKYKIL